MLVQEITTSIVCDGCEQPILEQNAHIMISFEGGENILTVKYLDKYWAQLGAVHFHGIMCLQAWLSRNYRARSEE